MEHVLHSQISSHLEMNNILTPNQHGFRKGLSRETQLISTFHDWSLSVDRKKQIDVTIPRVNIQKYLGVTITSDLSWSNHINNICIKANKTPGLLRRTLHLCSADVEKRAYESRVRPNVEYATTAWTPHTKKDISKLENVQRSVARFVSNDYRRTLSVTSMMQKVGWQGI